MWRWQWVTGLLSTLLITACASVDQPVTPRLQQQQANLQTYHQMLLNPTSSTGQLQRALIFFQSTDNLAAQWHAHHLLASRYLDQPPIALDHARQAWQLAQQLAQAPLQYASSVQMGMLTSDHKYYTQALAQALTPVDKALALMLLGDYQQSAALFLEMEPTSAPERMAFLYYQYGKHTSQQAAVMRALALYQSLGDVSGIIDSLYLAAQLEPEQEQAGFFARRALGAAQAVEDGQRTQVIESWLAEHAPSGS